jgi:hypothetical protein
MRCASCGSDNPVGAKFCEECSTLLVRIGLSCGGVSRLATARSVHRTSVPVL